MHSLLALAHGDRRRFVAIVACVRRWRLPIGIVAASLRRRFAFDHGTETALGGWEGVVLSIAPARLSASAEGGVDCGRRLRCSAGAGPLPSVQGSHIIYVAGARPLGSSPRRSRHRICAGLALAFGTVAAPPWTPQFDLQQRWIRVLALRRAN